MLDYLAADARTRAILLYVEGIGHGRKFMSAARAASRLKPVLVLKAGRSNAGARAATSHTGILAGADAGYEAAFRRAGICGSGRWPNCSTQRRLWRYCPTALAQPDEAARAVIDAVAAAGPAALRDRNVITAWLGEHSARPARKLFAEARIATYESPESARRRSPADPGTR